MNLEEQIKDTALKSVNEAIIKVLTSDYNSPLKKLTEQVIETHESHLKGIINEVFTDFINQEEFKVSVKAALSKKLAKVLVSKMEGSLEKQVNDLRNNPELRARITLAITDIVNEMSQVTS